VPLTRGPSVIAEPLVISGFNSGPCLVHSVVCCSNEQLLTRIVELLSHNKSRVICKCKYRWVDSPKGERDEVKW